RDRLSLHRDRALGGKDGEVSRVAGELDLRPGDVDDELVLPSLADDLDAFLPVGVVELDQVATARLDEPPVILRRLVVVGRRWVDFAPHRPDDAGAAEVALLKDDENFVVDLGTEERAPRLS